MSGQTPSTEELNKALFINLVVMLTSSAMHQLGRLPGPGGEKADIDLEGAQVSIDMLSMLHAKTEGNLGQDEQQMLDDALASLQMNYVQVANDQVQSGKGAKPSASPAGAAAAGQPPVPESGQPAPETPREPGAAPKFHKSYGG